MNFSSQISRNIVDLFITTCRREIVVDKVSEVLPKKKRQSLCLANDLLPGEWDDYTRTGKLKLQYKVAAKLPLLFEAGLPAAVRKRGVFHLPRDSGKFWKLRWEMLIGERRVPFDTLVQFIPGSLHRLMYFPPKYKMVAQLLLLNEMLDFSLEEECLVNSDDDDIPFLAAVATYMRRNLFRNKGFHENILPSYKLTIDEFKRHFRMTRGPGSRDLSSSVPRSTSHRKSS